MAYLHCHNPECRWEQDDFWHDGWNPVDSLQYSRDEWKKENFYEDAGMDDNWKEEIGYKRGEVVTRQELWAHDFDRVAHRIRGMVYRTMEEYREKNPEGICPKCGKKDLDID